MGLFPSHVQPPKVFEEGVDLPWKFLPWFPLAQKPFLISNSHALGVKCRDLLRCYSGWGVHEGDGINDRLPASGPPSHLSTQAQDGQYALAGNRGDPWVAFKLQDAVGTHPRNSNSTRPSSHTRAVLRIMLRCAFARCTGRLSTASRNPATSAGRAAA